MTRGIPSHLANDAESSPWFQDVHEVFRLLRQGLFVRLKLSFEFPAGRFKILLKFSRVGQELLLIGLSFSKIRFLEFVLLLSERQIGFYPA